MQTSVSKSYVAIAAGTITCVRHVLGMVRPVDCRCVHHSFNFYSRVIGYNVFGLGELILKVFF